MRDPNNLFKKNHCFFEMSLIAITFMLWFKAHGKKTGLGGTVFNGKF